MVEDRSQQVSANSSEKGFNKKSIAQILLLAALAAMLFMHTLPTVTGEDVTVEDKAGTVVQDEEASGDAQKTTADGIETIGEEGAKIKITSKNLKPPAGWRFRQFHVSELFVFIPQVTNPGPEYPSRWVDFHKGPPTPETPEVLNANSDNIKFIAIFPQPTTAGTWPLRAEGNLTPTGGGGGTLVERHWRVEVSDAKITIAHADGNAGLWANEVNGIKRPSPDNTIQFTATIEPASLQHKIRFVLIDTSKEAGINMNTNLAANPQDALDLTFENQTGFDNPAGTKQEILESTGTDNTATVTVTAHDYGPFAKIKAVIEGTDIESTPIPVLNDTVPTGGNNIEDAWDTANPAPTGGSLAADDDQDDAPNGDGKKGDRLTRYEEYRGFTAGGTFVSTKPNKKTVFLQDKTSHTITDGGAGVLSLFSKLDSEVVFVADGEYNGNREINFNGGADKQRAVLVENSDQTFGAWGRIAATIPPGDNGARPSSYTSCRVWIHLHTRNLKLAGFLPNNGDQLDCIAYIESDISPSEVWHNNGRVKIDNEVFQYQSGEAGFFDVSQTTNSAKTPAASKTVIVGTQHPSNNTFNNTIVNETSEIIELGVPVIGRFGKIKITIVIADNEIEIKNVGSMPNPPDAGQFVYMKIGDGEDAEWVSYEDVDPLVGGFKLKKVQRGLLGTDAIGHAVDTDVLIPYQYYNSKRGQYGTVEQDIAVGSTIQSVGLLKTVQRAQADTAFAAHVDSTTFKIFANVDDAIRMTAAHETAHVTQVTHAEGRKIMSEVLKRGAYLDVAGTGIYDDYVQESKDEFNAR